MARLIGAVLLAATLITPASAADLKRCAAIADDGRRLACYDVLAGRRATAGAAVDRARIRDDIIERCQRQMGSYGPAMVKGCVDMDLEAHTALARYPAMHKSIVERCSRQMRGYGRADMDFESARALDRMKSRDRVPVRGVRAWRRSRYPAGRAVTLRLPRWAA